MNKWLLMLVTAAVCGAQVPDPQTFKNLGFSVIPPGMEFPSVSFTDQNGTVMTLEDFSGSVILLNFWASWCPPCRAEMPSMESLATRLESHDFVMLPVNVQENPEMVSTFLSEYKIGFPVYFDRDASAAQAVGIRSLPTSVLLDRDGTAVAAIAGAIEWDSPQIVEMFSNWTRSGETGP